jgi:hypothetical protein
MNQLRQRQVLLNVKPLKILSCHAGPTYSSALSKKWQAPLQPLLNQLAVLGIACTPRPSADKSNYPFAGWNCTVWGAIRPIFRNILENIAFWCLFESITYV